MNYKIIFNFYKISIALFLSASCTSYSEKNDSVKIADLEWMTDNLSVSAYSNGDNIPYIEDSAEWASAKYGAWCYYNNDSLNARVFGKLYNWYAVNDKRGLCPKGWHITTLEEWDTVVAMLGGENVAGAKMKATSNWNVPNIAGTNESKLSVVPGGNRKFNGHFNGLGNSAPFWTSNEYDGENAWARFLNKNHSRVGKKYGEKTNGLICRCIKDKQN